MEPEKRMTADELRECRRILGYTNGMIAEKSGVPLGTVQKVLGGITKCPRKKTYDALFAVLAANNRNWRGRKQTPHKYK